MGSDDLVEKYTRLLLLQPKPLKLPSDIVLNVPTMKRVNGLSDEQIKREVFPLFTPITHNTSTKANVAFNELPSPEVIRLKMIEIILKHPERVQNGWGLTNDTISKEGMTTDDIQEVLKKKAHHIIPVIA